jgi:hypothetical protein
VPCTIYTYNDSAHKQAVMAIIGGHSFAYDDNGNPSIPFRASTTTSSYDAGRQRVKTESPDGTIIYTSFLQFEEEVGLALPLRHTRPTLPVSASV